MEKNKIIIIEDDILTSVDLQEILRRSGHQIMGNAKNFQEAQMLLAHQKPDLAIVDIKLRGSSHTGLEIAEILLKPKGIPFIFLTSLDDQSVFDQARPLLPAAFLTKPFRPKEVVYQVELALAQAAQKNSRETNPIHADAFFIYCENSHLKIEKKNIVLIKAETSYCLIYLAHESKPYLVTIHLKKIASFLPSSNFFRLSRTFLINLDYLTKFDQENVWLMGLDFLIPIPQSNKKELMSQLAIVKIT